MKPLHSSFTKRNSLGLLCISLFLICFVVEIPNSTFASEIKSKELIKIPTRDGITQKFVLLTPEKPIASLILFNGGDGKIESGSAFGNPYIKKDGNFLVRTRKDFVEHGFMVAVIDVPSDCKNDGMNSAWRVSEKHVRDIKGVINYLIEKEDIPVFLVGTSMGSISVGMGGIYLADSISGLVFSSTITYVEADWPMYEKYPNGVLDLPLEKITIPSFIVAHSGDECRFSPPSGASKLKTALVNCSQAESKLFDGGKKPKKQGCSWWSQHSYYGIEEKVVSEIADFIKSNI